MAEPVVPLFRDPQDNRLTPDLPGVHAAIDRLAAARDRTLFDAVYYLGLWLDRTEWVPIDLPGLHAAIDRIAAKDYVLMLTLQLIVLELDRVRSPR